MNFFELEQNGYKIRFLYNKSILKINVKDKKEKGEEQSIFVSISLNFKKKFTEFFSDFSDLINKIKDKNIQLNVNENETESELKYLNLEIKINDNIIISKKIYTLNVNYYLTKGINHERINSIPFLCSLEKENFNIDDLFELIDIEDIPNNYNIDSISYFNDEKGVFQSVNRDMIPIKKKNIFEFHINGIKNSLIENFRLIQRYITNEIIKIKNIINKISDKVQKYDLIYLYASPIINNESFEECDSPISYMSEIRIILELIKKSGKKFNCKIECADEELLRDIITNNKTKILHISSHGDYDGKYYYLCLENLKKCGQVKKVKYNQLEFLLNSNKENISKMDLVFVSTCYSQDFGELFLKCGAKNVIFIQQKTEIRDPVSVKFTQYFYQNLTQGYSIKESYKKAIESIKIDKEVLNLNYESCCCNHYHFDKSDRDIRKYLHSLHKHEKKTKEYECKCQYIHPNYHDKDCEFYQKFKETLLKAKKFSNPENIVKDKDITIYYKQESTNSDDSDNNKKKHILIKEDKDKNIICCCDINIEHSEILKIVFKPEDGDYINLSSFNLNGKGKLSMKSTIKFYYDEKRSTTIIGRKKLMGKIFNNISKNGSYVFIYGEKEQEKVNFAETLCVYLSERKIIGDYKIYNITSKSNYNYMVNEIDKSIEYNKIKVNKKNVKIIKFNFPNNSDNTKYLNEIFKKYIIGKYNNELYFIFIFDFVEEKDIKFTKYIEESLKGIIQKKNDEYIFNAGYNLYSAQKLFYKLTKDIKLNLTEKDRDDLLTKIAKFKPKNIRIICELFNQGKTIEEIKNMDKLVIQNIKIDYRSLSYPIYFLLVNMPSGLPDSFLILIIENYASIFDDQNLITKKNNWNIINENKIFDENWNDRENIKIYYKCLFKTLELYTKLLNYFIEINREQIKYRGGIVHCIFNSYSNRDLWKCKIPNTISKKLGDKIFSEDFNIHKHKKNIANLIELIINNIEIFRQIEEIEDKIDFFLENILLLFPSYFFIEKENIEILQKCITFCNRLIEKTKESNDEKLIKNEIYLKNKLLLFLYSIDENATDILEINDLDEKDKLKIEIDILQNLRQKVKDIKDINHLEELINKDISDEMKYFIFRKIAIAYYSEEKYDKCLDYLKKILSYKFNDIEQYRAIIDYCYVFLKKFNKDKKDNKNEINGNYELIKTNIESLNRILMKPLHRNIYYEAFYLRREIYNLIEPDIVMLNSNSLKNFSNNIYPLNNQYYILSEIKKDILEKTIKTNLAIKYNILNQNNLADSLNEKGEILIIQTDDCTKNGDIICESENGESYKLPIKDFITIFKNKEINYKIIILCFPNSCLLKRHFDENSINYKYLITFEKIDNFSPEILEQYNKMSIQFILDFIIKISVNDNDNIENIFNKFAGMKYKLKCEKNEKLFKENKISQKIELHNEIKGIEVYLYDPLLNLDNIDNVYNYDYKEYSSEVCDLIEILNYRNNKIFYCEQKEKPTFLKTSIEVMKFFHRHKTYCEYFYIDIQNGDKRFLKSIIEKLKKIVNENDEYNQNEEIYDDNENFKQKPCFILINNCTMSDLNDVNFNYILNSGSSFIIIYDKEFYPYNKYQIKQKIEEMDKDKDKKEENEKKEDNKDNEINENNNIIYDGQNLNGKGEEEKKEDKEKKEKFEDNVLEYENINTKALNGKNILIVKFNNDKIESIIETIDEKKEDKEDKGLDDEKYLRNYIINNKLKNIKNGNLYEYLKLGIQLKEEEVKVMFYKIIKIVQELHKNKIYNLDLEPINIMLDEKYNPVILYFNKDKLNSQRIIDESSPLECYDINKGYDGFKADIFKLGILLFNLFFKHNPFTFPLNKCNLYKKIKENKIEDFWDNISKKNVGFNPSDEFKKLFDGMISYNPNDRITIEDMLKSDWLRETNKLNLEENIYNKCDNKWKDIINKRNKKIKLGIYEEVGYQTRSIDIDREEYFDEDIKSTYENPDNYNYVIKIEFEKGNGNLFMNALYKILREEFKFNDSIDLMPQNSELEIIIDEKIEEKYNCEKGEELEEKEEAGAEELRYSIKLYEDINNFGEYFLRFNYINGRLTQFYKRFEEINHLIENMIL